MPPQFPGRGCSQLRFFPHRQRVKSLPGSLRCERNHGLARNPAGARRMGLLPAPAEPGGAAQEAAAASVLPPQYALTGWKESPAPWQKMRQSPPRSHSSRGCSARAQTRLCVPSGHIRLPRQRLGNGSQISVHIAAGFAHGIAAELLKCRLCQHKCNHCLSNHPRSGHGTHI